MKVVGVISDTHGLLRLSAVAALRSCDLIVHAGDIGKPAVLEGLRALAPVTAIRGNVDKAWAASLPETVELGVGGRRLLVLHNRKDLEIRPHEAGIDVVISGHSHQPAIDREAGVLYVNPGSAGPRRFRLPIAVARIEISGESIEARIVELVE